MLKGKTTKGKPYQLLGSEAPVPTITPIVRTVQMLYIDTLQIQKSYFVIAVSHPLNLTTVAELKSKTKNSYKVAMNSLLEEYGKELFDISMIHSDMESSIVSLANTFAAAGYKVNLVSADSHVPVVERSACAVMSLMRNILFLSLWFLGCLGISLLG